MKSIMAMIDVLRGDIRRGTNIVDNDAVSVPMVMFWDVSTQQDIINININI